MQYLIKITIIVTVLLVSALMVLFFAPTPSLLEERSFSTAVYDDTQHLLRLSLNKEDKFRLFTPLSEMSPELIAATLLQEDQYFRWHPGVNPVAMIKAACQTYLFHSRRFGASTISMQLARLRFGIHSKTVKGKLWQMIRALQLELHYSKDDILEAYLNLAPYGGNIEGVGTASLVYFNKPVKKAGFSEILTLTVIPQNPTLRRSDNAALKASRNKLLTRWLLQHPEDKDKTSLFNLPLDLQTTSTLPFIAPHFVNTLLSDLPSTSREIQTTLDSRLQKIVERITRNYITRNNSFGVRNAAVLLVDTRDMGIKASLGSVDFFNNSISGQINGTEIKHSPGSTLKPFIYALAIDQGLIHPNTVLKDVPHSFGSYNPENFDYDFMGPLKARDALVLSRNIPAIYLASQLKSANLYQLLAKAQTSSLKSESYYGLALALGGAELSMKELSGLYAMLQNDGLWRPLRMQKQDPQVPGIRLLSPEASFLVLDMLKDTPRPGMDISSKALRDAISWKTGTSSGFRDAWTIGTLGPYILTVWIGNFDNKGNPAFVGKRLAAPLFFELAAAIKNETGTLPVMTKYPEHMNLVHIPVCKASGMLPTRYCTDTEESWFIPGKSPILSDTIYQEVAINSNTGLRTCHFDEHTRFEIFEFWPSDLLEIFKKAGIRRRTPPYYERDCALHGNNANKPQITSPRTESIYIVLANVSEQTLIPLSAVTDAGVGALYWFANDTFLGRTPPDKVFFWNAKPGQYVIRVVDSHGQSDARDIHVQVDN